MKAYNILYTKLILWANELENSAEKLEVEWEIVIQT